MVQVKTPKLLWLGWQAEQGLPEWRPLAIGKSGWLKTAWSQLRWFVWWHRTQSVGKPAAVWFGSLVALKSSRWQPTHSRGVPW